MLAFFSNPHLQSHGRLSGISRNRLTPLGKFSGHLSGYEFSLPSFLTKFIAMNPEHFDLHADMESRHWWFVARRRIIYGLVRAVLAPGERRVVVDYGCGTGANVAVMVPAYDAIGLDVADDALAHARNRFPSCVFEKTGEIERENPHLSNADLVLLLDVIEHVDDDKAFMDTLIGRLKPGAKILVTVPAKMSLWGPQDEAVGHRRRYEKQSLLDAFAGSAARVRMISYLNARLFPIILCVRAGGRLFGRAYGSSGTDFRMPSNLVNRLLTAVFAGESRVLLGLIEGRRKHGFSVGASLIAVLEKSG